MGWYCFGCFALLEMIKSIEMCKVWELKYAKGVCEWETVYHFRLFGVSDYFSILLEWEKRLLW